jgi:hypothetical protein
VRWILKEKSKTTEFSVPSGGGATSPVSIRDDVTATSSDLPDAEFNISSIHIADTVGVEVDSDLSDEHLDDEESDHEDDDFDSDSVLSEGAIKDKHPDY